MYFFKLQSYRAIKLHTSLIYGTTCSFLLLLSSFHTHTAPRPPPVFNTLTHCVCPHGKEKLAASPWQSTRASGAQVVGQFHYCVDCQAQSRAQAVGPCRGDGPRAQDPAQKSIEQWVYRAQPEPKSGLFFAVEMYPLCLEDLILQWVPCEWIFCTCMEGFTGLGFWGLFQSPLKWMERLPLTSRGIWLETLDCQFFGSENVPSYVFVQ